jgi:ABC-type multidrug transport system permease subunit
MPLLQKRRILHHMRCPIEPFPMSVQPVIAIERIVYHRERAAGMYAAMPYALAQGDVEIPYLVVQTLLWSIITYWMFGFEASAGIAGSALHER